MAYSTTTQTLNFTGKSGRQYVFRTYPISTSFLPVAAVYIFTKKTGYLHTPVYVGQTVNVRERFSNHHAAACIRARGATHVSIMRVDSLARREAIERDLIEGYQPPCNAR